MHRVKQITLLLLTLLLCISGCQKAGYVSSTQNKSYDAVIGIVFYDFEHDMLGQAVKKYADYLEANFNVKIICKSPGWGSEGENVIEELCQQGVDVILSSLTNDIPTWLSICEQNGVYWLQIMDITLDTDLYDKYKENPNYLGYIVCDEEKASISMAQHMLNSGLQNIGLFSLSAAQPGGEVHVRRFNAIQNTILAQKENALEFSFQGNIQSSVESMARQGYQPDGLITTTSTFFYTVDELKELYGNDNLKISYFDLNDQTRQEFEAGNLVIVSCGQHNIIGLAFAYAYHFVTSPYRRDQKLQLTTNYILLSSLEEYDQYIGAFVGEMPYSAKQLTDMITSLDSDLETLKRYCTNYSVENVIKYKENE